MRKGQLILLSITVATFISCGNNTHDEVLDKTKQERSFFVEVGADEYLSEYIQGKYEYCVDINSNYTCDNDEPKTNYEKNKKVTISSKNENIKSNNILLAPTTTKDKALQLSSHSNDNMPTFAKPLGDGIISLKTSVRVLLGAMNKEKQDKIMQQLSLNDNSSLAQNTSNNIIMLLQKNDYARLGEVFEFLSQRQDNAEFKLSSDNFQADNIMQKITQQKQKEQKEKAMEQKSKLQMSLNDTGLKSFFTGTELIDEESEIVKTDYPDQDAKFGYDATDGGFKFVKLDSKGEPLADQNSNSGYECVKDKRTGLVWEIKSLDVHAPNYAHSTFSLDVPLRPSLEDDSPECNKATGGLKDCKTSTYIQFLNDKKHCGISNWRLPTAQEQFNIVDFSFKNKIGDYYYALDTSVFNDLETNTSKIDDNDLGEIGYYNSTIKQYDDLQPNSEKKYYNYFSVISSSPSNMTNSVVITDSNKLFLRLVSKGEK